MRNLFSSPLGASIAPIGIPKCSATAVALGVGAGVAGIAGGIANLVGAADTNKTNYRIWQEQLQYAKEQYERERLENRALINEERQYNLPVNERERLLAAGINPALAKYGGSGSLSSVGVGSTPTAKLPDAPRMMNSDYSFIGNSVTNALSVLQSSEANTAQIEAMRQDMNNKYLDTLDKLANSSLDRETKKFLMQDLSRKWQFDDETWDARKKALDYANDSVRENTIQTRLQNDALKFANSIAPELHRMEKERFAKDMSQIVAAIAELNSRADVNSEQKKLISKQVIQQHLINKDLPKSLHNDNAIKVATYKEVQNRANLLNQQFETEKWHTYDVKRGARWNNVGSNRPMSDIVDEMLRSSNRVKVK